MARDVRLIRSPLSVAGMVLTTASAVVFLVVFLADLFGLHTNPYLGIVFFLLLPAVFVLGLALIPFGAWVERRRRAAGKAPSAAHWPHIDLNDPTTRLRVVLVFVLTFANVVIVSLAAYRGVEYMDSVAFCGQVCHTVMKPEFVAHRGAPHSQVTCVECHVGPGAASFVKTKMAGTRRLLAVSFQSYPRPLPRPAEGLGPTRDICEQCHSPERVHGEKIRRVYEYSDTEQNAESVTTLRMRVGGGAGRGIHWHASAAVEIDYVSTDEKGEVIPYVRVKDRDGSVREYVTGEGTPVVPPGGPRRRMDCMDCHSRPSHPIAATPERAVNEAMAGDRIPKTLPFVHREAVKALKAAYPSEDAAMAAIADALAGFYRSQYPPLYAARKAEIDRAAGEVQNIYRQNVFPDMKVTFGTYPEQHRSRGRSGLLPLPRRQPQDQGWPDHRPGLRHMSRHRITLFALAWILAIGVYAVSGRAAAVSATSAPQRGAAPAPSEQFVGDETCVACHESEGTRLKATLHGKSQNARTPAATGQACETCHGPGREHAESGDKTKIRVFGAIAPREASATCLSCHERGSHTLWKGSVHDTRNMSCVSCHSVHKAKSVGAQLKAASITATCASCHKTQVAKLQRFGHMPVREGKMECSACHNPHGSTSVKLLKVGNWVNETCVSCHTEKRGPYLWDHAPVREACNTCHDPHGSNNERMLVAKLPMLCQRCHIGTRHPSTIYDGTALTNRSNRLIGRSCVNCHAQIHGSNSPAGHAFLR